VSASSRPPGSDSPLLVIERTAATVSVALRLPATPEGVFQLIGDPEWLTELSPSFLRFDIRSPRPVTMALGRRIDYRLRWRGIPFPWQSHVTEWQPPRRFTYEQGRGPFRRFVHRHLLEPTVEGTSMRDEISLASWAGRRVDEVLFVPEVERILRLRASRLHRLVSAGRHTP